jgi:hypothetical protein
MKRIVGSTLIITSLYIASICSGHAFDIDETVDDEIRKNYNPSQLIQDVGVSNSALNKKLEVPQTQPTTIDENLPALPSISKQNNSQKQYNSKNDSEILVTKRYAGGNIKIKSGTSFNVINSNTISDWQKKGTSVKFKLKGNKFGKNYTIPSGTIFLGEIIESHQPQITCNGGLIVIKVDTMIYKEQRIPITAYVTRANDKKIFFNNIKGERNYLKTTWQKGNWGRTLFNKMLTVSSDLGSESSTLILTPFPFTYGTLCLGLSAITSPICAFFSKGGHISIPTESNFRIKLLDEIMIN